MEEKGLCFVWCMVSLGLLSNHLDALSIPPVNEMGTNSHEIRGNLRNLLNSISDNNPKETRTYRDILQKEAAQDKQMFDMVKEDWRFTQKRRASVPLNSHKVGFKRRAGEPEAPSTCPSVNPADIKIEFITADIIAEKGALNETFHYVCKLPDDERVQFCKKVLQEDFAKRNNIKYVDGVPLGSEKKYDFTMNGSQRLLLLKRNVVMTACTCPTEPVLYLRNDFGKAEAVQAYVLLPYEAHGNTE